MKNNKKGVIVALLAVVLLLLAALALPPLPKSKVGASRIQTVNHVASVLMAVPTTNAPSSAVTK